MSLFRNKDSPSKRKLSLNMPDNVFVSKKQYTIVDPDVPPNSGVNLPMDERLKQQEIDWKLNMINGSRPKGMFSVENKYYPYPKYDNVKDFNLDGRPPCNIKDATNAFIKNMNNSDIINNFNFQQQTTN